MSGLEWFMNESRPSSVSSEPPSEPNPFCGFGWDAPIIDFYENGQITKFVPMNSLLQQGPEKVMAEAFDSWVQDKRAYPNLGGRRHRRMRWVHIPSNNMEWVERVIKCVSRSKATEKQKATEKRKAIEKQRDTEKQKAVQNEKVAEEENAVQKEAAVETIKADDPIDAKSVDYSLADVDNESPMCLRAEYWRDQQRGCIEHCASHPLYARHMIPFFSPILGTDKGEEAQSIEKDNVDNMVLFMPYLHWATSGRLLTERNALIRSLGRAFKVGKYHRPSYEEVDKMNISPKLKLMKAFLFPKNDRCLHIRRTLDQFYYSTLPQDTADKRTDDQVVYRFAMKQHQKQLEEKRQAERKLERDLGTRTREGSSNKSELSKNDFQVVEREFVEQDKSYNEPSWIEPKVMMVNQLWLWVIDGDTVLTSFPAKQKSDLDRYRGKSKEREDILDGCFGSREEVREDYDSTDIWRSVFREIRLNTEYGKRSRQSALHLAWAIADQAAGVFHKRSLHPHLQFIDMFEMEINEIAFKQAEAFDTFMVNVQFAHTANELSKVLSSLDCFQKELFLVKQVPVWRNKFSNLKTYLIHKLNCVTYHNDNDLERRGLSHPGNNTYTPHTQNEEPNTQEVDFDEELAHELLIFMDMVANAHQIQEVNKSLCAAYSDLDTSIATFDCSLPVLETTDDEINSTRTHLESAREKLEKTREVWRTEETGVSDAIRYLGDAIASLDMAKSNLYTAPIVNKSLKDSKSYIDRAKSHLNYDIGSFVELLFSRLESRVKGTQTTTRLNKNLDTFILMARKSLDAYSEMILDDLFDIRTETNLVREIKDIIDELNIIQTIKRQQQDVIKPFREQMLPPSNSPVKDVYDCGRIGNHVDELRRSAEGAYRALSDLLDLKQKESSAIEARSASKDAKASAVQAEEAAELSKETVKQGWSIMVFTIVTIVFLPLSFFTSLFGMNAKEIMAGDYTIGFFSAIMWPISFVVTCFSLGLALNVKFRGWTRGIMNIILWYTGIYRLGRFGSSLLTRSTREHRTYATSSAYKKWEVGM